jgi:hypothetical protein
MRILSRESLCFCVEYGVVDDHAKTLRCVRYTACWDAHAPRYSTPTLEMPSAQRVFVRYHLGDKVRMERDARLSWCDADVLDPCDDVVRASGYTILAG